MSTETANQRAIAHATRSLLKGAGAKLAGRKRGPDRRVCRNSFDVDDRRARVFNTINGGSKPGGLRWNDTLLKVAHGYDLVGKQKGRMGPLGPHTRDVLAALLSLVDFKTGRLEPSYAKPMAMTGYAKSTVSSALRRLRAYGFLNWVRRSRIVETDEGEARQQTSNAFFFDLGRLPRRAWLRFRSLLDRRERAAQAEAPATAATPDPAPAGPPDFVGSLDIKDRELQRVLHRMQASIDRGAE